MKDNAYAGDALWQKHMIRILLVIMFFGVSIIGCNAFSNCSVLKSVIISNGVTSIGDHAFWRCKALKRIFLPEIVTQGIQSIG